MKKIMKVSLLAACCIVILSVSTVYAKSSANLCSNIVPLFESLGYDVTMGQCVSANESGNPAMAICRNLQVGNPDLFDDYFGNFGQCLKEINRSLPKK